MTTVLQSKDRTHRVPEATELVRTLSRPAKVPPIVSEQPTTKDGLLLRPGIDSLQHWLDLNG
jgi:hypothetical protein